MASVYQNIEDVINGSLVRVGSEQRIGSIYDGSKESLASLDVYGQTRDDLLRQFDWGFAERDATLNLLKVAPVGGYTPPLQWSNVYPILPWIYEYEIPDDLLKVRALRSTPVFIPNYQPQAVNFRIANDNAYTPSKKVILCNLYQAVCVYTAQVTSPLLWEATFTETLVEALGRRLAPLLANLQTEQVEAAAEAVAKPTAEMIIG